MKRFLVGISLAVAVAVLAAPATAGLSFELSLEPESATNPVGTDHTVTATLTDDNEPLSNVFVTIAITSGPNVGESNDGCTDENGQLSLTWTGDGGAGTDNILAASAGQSCIDLAAVTTLGKGISDTATKTWVAESPPPPPAAPPSPLAPPPPAAEAPSGALPFTGMPLWILVLVGAGMIGAGALLLLPRPGKNR